MSLSSLCFHLRVLWTWFWITTSWGPTAEVAFPADAFPLMHFQYASWEVPLLCARTLQYSVEAHRESVLPPFESPPPPALSLEFLLQGTTFFW